MKLLFILLFVVSCSTAPKQEAISVFSDSHPDCRVDVEKLNLSFAHESTNQLARGVKTSGSLMFTTLGYVTDVAVIGAGTLALAWLCGDFFAIDCIDATDLFEGGYEGFGKRTFDSTQRWRCPYVDHISQAVRSSVACNYEHDHFIEAFEQLNFLNKNEVMRTCSSDLERSQVKKLSKKIKK